MNKEYQSPETAFSKGYSGSLPQGMRNLLNIEKEVSYACGEIKVLFLIPIGPLPF
jgi:hypothetical protein